MHAFTISTHRMSKADTDGKQIYMTQDVIYMQFANTKVDPPRMFSQIIYRPLIR